MPTQKVPAFLRRNKTVSSLGLTADVNADSVQLELLSTFVNSLPDAYDGGAPQWVSGTNYALGAFVYDAGIVYRKATTTAAGGTTAPAADTANFERVPVRETQYINGATDTKYLLYSGGKSYAFTAASAANSYAAGNGLTGVFVFTAHVNEPLTLRHNCLYEMAGFDVVVGSGATANVSAAAGTVAALRCRKIIRNGTATGQAVSIAGAGTSVSLVGDLLVSSSGECSGLITEAGASLRWRGNAEASGTGTVGFLVAQHGPGSYTELLGNVKTNTVNYSQSVYVLGGIFDLTGRVDVLGKGGLPRVHTDNSQGNPWLRWNNLGCSTKDAGVVLHNTAPCRLHLSGVIDVRDSTSTDPVAACGIYVTQPLEVDLRLDNVAILTKAGFASLKGQTNVTVNYPVKITGTFTATEPPQAGEFALGTLSPYRFPGGGSTATAHPSFTNPVTDDVNKFFRATLPANYTATDAEYTLDAGATTVAGTASMLSGGVMSAPVSGAKAAGQVGWRLKAAAGLSAGPWLFNVDAFTAPAANLVWDEDNAGLSYSAGWVNSTNGTTQGFGSGISHYGTDFKAAGAIGETVTFTVPGGYSALSMQGHKDTGGSFFTVHKNGVEVVRSDQYAPDFRIEEYLITLTNSRLAVAAGDVIVFTMTNSVYTTAAGSINVNTFIDQITFHV